MDLFHHYLLLLKLLKEEKTTKFSTVLLYVFFLKFFIISLCYENIFFNFYFVVVGMTYDNEFSFIIVTVRKWKIETN